MKGWTDEELKNRDLMAPCGLYCGLCGIYIATRDNNLKFRERLAGIYGSKPEETECLGCMQPDPAGKLYGYCTFCGIRDCVREKGFYSCHLCDQWPCDKITNFPISTGKRVMMRAIPAWREKAANLGDDEGSVAWAMSECERYHCGSCGAPLFRGAQRCRACKAEIAHELDGNFKIETDAPMK
jgi:hypothetical protein